MATECLRKTVPVGGKKDAVCPNSVLLQKDKPLTFGRVISTETNVRLLSRNTPLMISRKHATIAHSTTGRWTATDHESLNGVFINGRKIQANAPEILNIGDKITFGVGVDATQPEFEYILETMSKSKKRPAETQPGSSKDLPVKQRKVLSESDRNNINVQTSSSSHEDKIKAAEHKIELLSHSLEEKQKNYDHVIQELKQTESAMEDKLLQQKAALEEEKEDLEKNLKELLQKSLQEKEALLGEQLATQKALLIKEKEKVEEKLQQELNRKLELKDKELEEKLLCQKADLEKVISEKEIQQSELQKELSSYKSATEKLKDLEENEKKLVTNVMELRSLMEQKDKELQQQVEVTKKAEEKARKTVMEQMEDEFSCIICQELFIRAATLTCSHSFCEFCLQSWLRKKNTCPICRCSVHTQPVRSIVLDNAINRMVESMDEDSKERRRTVLEERAEKSRELAQTSGSQRHPIVVNDEQSAEARRHVRVNNEVQVIVDPRRSHMYWRTHNPGYNEGYDRDGYYQDHRNNNNPQRHAPQYRNHGLCFHCGMRGHWARGCPYRR